MSQKSCLPQVPPICLKSAYARQTWKAAISGVLFQAHSCFIAFLFHKEPPERAHLATPFKMRTKIVYCELTQVKSLSSRDLNPKNLE